ncbi:Zinc finger CCCH domain-containing protein 32, partial [Cucurbita argyrosperma subsp. sororia]
MGEEFRKRNTDCVYFLASPLTCKKGFDCEYRHSEIARLNPRDCYYWLAGNCLNAACSFRHPPMDGAAGKVFESSQSSVPVNKTNIPCYFYFNGFCSKGDTCTFLHGNDITVAARSTKIGNTSSSEDKTASSHKNGLASTDADAFLQSSKKVVGPTIEGTFRESFSHPSAENVSIRSACAKISLPECEKVAVDEPVSLPLTEGSKYSRSHVHVVADQSYEEPMMDSSEDENPLESSTGFDVVVGHELENLDSDDDSEYLLSTNLEQRELDTELCRDDDEDYIAYEPMHSDLELLYEREMHSYDHLERNSVLSNDRDVISCSRGKLIKSLFTRKRKLTLMNIDSEEWNRTDLRSYLQRDGVSGNGSIIGLSRRRNGMSRRTSRSFAKPWKDGLYHPTLGRRLPLHVGKVSGESLSENLTFSNSISGYRSFRHSRQYKPYRYYDGYRFARRQHPLSNISRRPVSREPVPRDHGFNLKSSVPFKGPKTLSQIKDEKRKVEENRGLSMKKRHSIGCASSSADFRGPKPLSDILKDKRKVEKLVKEIIT